MKKILFLISFSFLFLTEVYSQSTISAPTDVRVLPILSSTAIITWKPVSGATSYEIVDCSSNQVVAVIPESNYKVNNLIVGEARQFKVKAVSGAQSSAYTNCISVKTSNDPFKLLFGR